MSLYAVCPACKSKLKAKSEGVVGKKLPCPKCSTVFVVDRVLQGDDRPKESEAVGASAPAVGDGLPDLGDLGGDFGLGAVDLSNMDLSDLPPSPAAQSPRPKAAFASSPAFKAATGKKPTSARKFDKVEEKKGLDQRTWRIIGASGGVVVLLLLLVLMLSGAFSSGKKDLADSGADGETVQETKTESPALRAELKAFLVDMQARSQPNRTRGDIEAEFDGIQVELVKLYRQFYPEFLYTTPSTETRIAANKIDAQVGQSIDDMQNYAQRLNLKVGKIEKFIEAQMAETPSPIRRELMLHLAAAKWREALASSPNLKPPSPEDWQAIVDLESRIFGADSVFAPGAATSPEHQIEENADAALKTVTLAFHNFHDTFRSFPGPDRASNSSARGLSWRVWILPYVGEQALFDQFKNDEPWDSPHNQQFLTKMPNIYRTPGVDQPGHTSLHVFTGAGPFGAEKPARIADISDGTSHVVLCVMAGAELASPWTKPGGIEYQAGAGITLLGTPPVPRGFPAGIMDGSRALIPANLPADPLQQIVLANDGGLDAQQHFQPLTAPAAGQVASIRQKMLSLKPAGVP